ncbi:hypothetical protein HaLaN_02750 [Haematococcus lacustris]|uniref:Uncharacterized protein n=1 Tax=Haematococcus lacustris TaxID=44745 RepID=A0A699YEM3_HAELA|nr:hypothetical protein HaLaN_02750 [Haematococcus lacustris]
MACDACSQGASHLSELMSGKSFASSLAEHATLADRCLRMCLVHWCMTWCTQCSKVAHPFLQGSSTTGSKQASGMESSASAHNRKHNPLSLEEAPSIASGPHAKKTCMALSWLAAVACHPAYHACMSAHHAAKRHCDSYISLISTLEAPYGCQNEGTHDGPPTPLKGRTSWPALKTSQTQCAVDCTPRLLSLTSPFPENVY